MAWQFVRFGTVGAGGFLVDTAIVYGLRGSIGLYWSGAVAFVAAASCNWAGNRLWTFRTARRAPAHRQWLRFLAASMLGFVVNRGVFFALVTVSPLCAAQPVLPLAAGTAAGMVFNFGLSRALVFR